MAGAKQPGGEPAEDELRQQNEELRARVLKLERDLAAFENRKHGADALDELTAKHNADLRKLRKERTVEIFIYIKIVLTKLAIIIFS